MKRVFALILAFALLASLCACGGKKDEGAGGTQPAPENATEGQTGANTGESEEASGSGVEVDEGLFNVTLTIPAEFAQDMTQEEVDAAVADGSYKSAKLNEDGSLTVEISKKQHEDMMAGLASSFQETFDGLISDEGTNFVSIDHNDDFTEFTVVTTSTELNLTESFSVVTLYFAGGMYNAFAGNTVDNICVKFVNQASGEVIQEANSRDMNG